MKTIRRILCPVDFSAVSDREMELAIRLAERFQGGAAFYLHDGRARLRDPLRVVRGRHVPLDHADPEPRPVVADEPLEEQGLPGAGGAPRR